MKEMEIVFLNGEFEKASHAKVSIFDRGFIFGDGVYEVIPVLNSHLVDRKEFWERFSNSMKATDLALPYSCEEFEKILYELIARNSLEEGGIYMQITRGVASRDFKFTGGEPTVMAFAFSDTLLQNPKAKEGVSVISVPDIRWKRRDIKCLSLLGQCMAKNEAAKAGAFEAIMVENGLITEGSSSSLFIIKDEVLITKPLSNEILAGIRRGNVLKIADKMGLKSELKAISMEELLKADEAFISSATLLVMPVVKVDGQMIGDGKVGKLSFEIRKLYEEKISKEAK